jgi:hephaestin
LENTFPGLDMLRSSCAAAATASEQEANKKHSVNGYIFCNMPEIMVPEGARLRLVLIGVGGEDDMHTPGFTNHVQETPAGSTYVVELYPGSARVSGLYAGKEPRKEPRVSGRVPGMELSLIMAAARL